ncbi:DUF397 domain-containing protein [Streptomyces prasinus]|uniref:DUF397 domain-containing protein n=1 Tax=Streptomyces prasinus TaxID=67345 RepID=UPI0033AF91AB
MATHAWKRSSFCGGGGNNCLEVAIKDGGDGIAIRNSTRPAQVIKTSRSAFTALITELRANTANDPEG